MSCLFRFGEFRLDRASRRLWHDGVPVVVTARALDTLIVLVENAGRVVSKEELIETVWGGLIVDENNLNQQISVLRRTLGDDQRYIETVPRRGYCFVAEVATSEGPPPAAVSSPRPPATRVVLLALLLLTVAVLVVEPLVRRDAGPPQINHMAVLPLANWSGVSLDPLRSGVSDDLRERLRRSGVAVRGATAGQTSRKPPFAAYEAHLKGQHHFARRTVPDFEKSVAYYRRALDIDPEYAKAYAGLAMALGFLDRKVAALDATQKALALDPNQAELRAYLGLLRLHYDYQPELARREFERAMAIDPDNPVVHHWYAFYFSCTGQHVSAVRTIRRARELDPLSLIITTDVGVILSYANRPAEAVESFQKALDLDPTFLKAHTFLAFAYEQLGRDEEALAELERVELEWAQVPALVRLGRTEQARAILDAEVERVRADPGARVNLAALAYGFAALGDRERGFEWLERAYRHRHDELITLAVSHRFEPLRGDPRYDEMLVRLQLKAN